MGGRKAATVWSTSGTQVIQGEPGARGWCKHVERTRDGHGAHSVELHNDFGRGQHRQRSNLGQQQENRKGSFWVDGTPKTRVEQDT